MKQLTSYEGTHCANCGTPMQGEFCHECGQSIHSVLQPMHHMLEETVETVLHIDSRIVHTLPPLLLKPGFLTLEYFSGRRVRYIAPFRLMFVLCLLSFFVFHLAVDQITAKPSEHRELRGKVGSSSIEAATTPAQVRKALQDGLDGLQQARDTGMLPQMALAQTDIAAREMRQKANQRLIALGAAPLSSASLAASPTAALVQTADSATPVEARPNVSTDESKPIRIGWLPEVANERLAMLVQQIRRNLRAYKDGDAAASAEAKQRMINGVFSTLPPAMFVLIPVFAGLLKLFYIFRRRLYMEHLIVALHSHAFIFLSLLLIVLTSMLSTWLKPHAAWTSPVLGVVEAALMLWGPIYLLLMQKRVYRQGWPMTLLKFWFVGWFYYWLLVIAVMVAAALGIAH